MEIAIVLSGLCTGILVSIGFYCGYRMGSSTHPHQPVFRIPSPMEFRESVKELKELKEKRSLEPDAEDVRKHEFFD